MSVCSDMELTRLGGANCCLIAPFSRVPVPRRRFLKYTDADAVKHLCRTGLTYLFRNPKRSTEFRLAKKKDVILQCVTESAGGEKLAGRQEIRSLSLTRAIIVGDWPGGHYLAALRSLNKKSDSGPVRDFGFRAKGPCGKPRLAKVCTNLDDSVDVGLMLD